MVAEFARYAGALLLPLLLIGSALAVVVGGLALILPADNRFLRVSFVSLGALLVGSSCWLVLYASGTDTYYEPTRVSRWEYAAQFMGTWPVTLAVIAAVATSIGLFTSATSVRIALRFVVAPVAAISCLLLIFGWYALTAGH